jgi:catechol 2,3-dioxygenase-like lactoylglutathione lyase family enzyme
MADTNGRILPTTPAKHKRTVDVLGRNVGAGLQPGESSIAQLALTLLFLAGESRESRMAQTLSQVTLLVRDYDEAVAFFTNALGFQLIEDTPQDEGRRWVVVAPAGSHGSSLLLAQASTPEQTARVGNQTGGRVFLFLHTDDFGRDYREMKARGVKFLEAPREEVYATVAVFEDLYGNKWDLLGPPHAL